MGLGLCNYRGRATLEAPSQIGIGELSRLAQCNIETIRYYERVGLLPKPRRTGGRFRRYDDDDVARLRFIRRARQLGFTLDEVGQFTRLAQTDEDPATCAEAQRLAVARLRDIRRMMVDLQAMEGVLMAALCECEAGQHERCPLIEVLSGDDPIIP